MIVRLILLILLAFLGYTAINAIQRFFVGSANRDQDDSDTMVPCAQCATYIPVDSALKRKHAGKTYYFCNKNCLDLYRKQP